MKNKQPKITKANCINRRNSIKLSWIALSVLLMVFGGVGLHGYNVQAESATEEIRRLAEETANDRMTLDRLQLEAESYQDAINRMQAEISDIEVKLSINLTEQSRLQSEIKDAEEELAEQKSLLGQNIRAMYIEGDMSTIEMLASSNNLSEYIDKQQYREAVKNKIKTTLAKITTLRLELRDRKDQVDKLVVEQKAQQDNLIKTQSEQSQLLSMNRGQQTEFNKKISTNSSRLQQLIDSQRDANITDGGYYFIRFPGAVRDFDPNNYEYRGYGHSQADAPCPGPPISADSVDRWGYCTRQCVSYAAWAVENSGRVAPKQWGDAKKWVTRAYAEGVPVYRTPQKGDIAISTNGYWGHAMYVESVSGNTFNTSEYNTGLDGRLYNKTRKF